jgi:putative transposase
LRRTATESCLAASHDIMDLRRCNCNALKGRPFPGRPTLPHSSADTFQMEALHSRRTYDYRIQEANCESGERDLFPELKIPRSTIRSWIHRGTTDVVAGSENVNRNVDDELEGIDLERVLAQIDVTYSNLMIEAFGRSLKHSWIYLHRLETESELRRLIAVYVEAHDDVIPHSAFDGQTPNEVFFGTGDAVVANLAAERVQAQTERMDRNRSAGCGVCIRRAG